MKASEVRQAFLDFFAQRGHEVVHSSSLVPANDPTLLFSNAGMVQFKDLFTGQETRSYARATSSQRCVRAGGKHNDLDEVGKTARHHTFFEMLGNFSFGDYFKEDAIKWAWSLLTESFGIDPNRLVVSVFKGDDELGVGADLEAKEIWQDITGFSDERILLLPKAENFWMMGETGPMGPCSEIHYLGRDGEITLPTDDPNSSSWNGWLEIWNLVFMQYERREAGGVLHPLPAPSIDTGAGLERVTSVLQGKQSNYDTDLFLPLLHRVGELAGKKYGHNEKDSVSMRVIADHARTVSFLIADGVFPDKTGREYVLRRIFRRAIRHGKQLGIVEPFFHHVCEKVVEEMSGAYPELAERTSTILEVTQEEEKRFRSTLDRGLNLLESAFESAEGSKVIAGETVFQLYDTYGFPDDLTEIIAEERGFTIDHKGFERAMQEARERSKFTGSDSKAVSPIFKQLSGKVETDFLGYETLESSSSAEILIQNDTQVGSVTAGEFLFVAPQTPFYGESGGQTGDTGWFIGPNGRGEVLDTQKPTGTYILHRCKLAEGSLSQGDSLELRVDKERRLAVMANHSATHLLNHALRTVLGDHVAQKGSLVQADKLRFDFSHFNPLSMEEKEEIEKLVNQEIVRNRPSETEVLPIAEAKAKGAVAMFGEKYGETVRVVTIGDESIEFCGGTHVSQAGDIGLFKIVSEGGIAQGVRRIEAVTRGEALEYVQGYVRKLAEAGQMLKTGTDNVLERIERLQESNKKLEREVASLKTKLASGGGRNLLEQAVELGGVNVLAVEAEIDDAKALRETGDTLKQKLGSGAVFLVGVGGEKLTMLAMVTKDLEGKVHAGNWLKQVAQSVGGRGGGRPDMAQGGCGDPSKSAEVLRLAKEYFESS